MARIVFMGTPPFAVPSLERMAAEHDVVAVYSQPPRPSGGDEGRVSAVHARAEELSLHVETPNGSMMRRSQVCVRLMLISSSLSPMG